MNDERMDDDERHRRARARVGALRGFTAHAAGHALVIGGLLALTLITSPAYLWFVWPLLGWGGGVAMHAFGVFAGRLGRGREARQIGRLLGRSERRQGHAPSAATWPELRP